MTQTLILKLGGSLLTTGRDLMQFLSEYAFVKRTTRQMVIVPGGGPFAESVRALQRRLEISDDTAHWMAVLTMHQYGLFLASGAPETPVLERLEDVRATRTGLCILLPYRVLRADDALPHTWHVTSDTIAAFIAHKLGENTLIKLTDVDGLLDENGALIDHLQAQELLGIEHTGCIDAQLPRFLLEHGMSCVIVNGRHPERVIAVIEGRATICTRIE
ncbi:MAG TPA: amino acid kinase [Methanomicrobia archaeon]|nr:amino acid kinase [Methanomicrobia archaeon]